MTREEAHKAAEVMMAYADGKEIEVHNKSCDNEGWYEFTCPNFDWYGYDYRVKAESKYRPYKDSKEAFAEAKKHGFWMLDGQSYINILVIEKGCIITDIDTIWHFDKLVKCKWADDGTPCGIKED